MKYIWVEKAFTLKYLGYWQYDKMNGCGHLKNKNFQVTNDPIDYKDLDSSNSYWVSYQGEF